MEPSFVGSNPTSPANFEEHWDKAVSHTENLRFRSLDEKQLKERGKRLMEIYHQLFSGVLADDIELFFELPMLDLATGQYAEQTIQGRIDLVSKGTLYEFKTSSKSYTQDQADESLQLTFYSWAYQYLSKQILIDENLNELDGIEEYIGIEAGVDFISCAECSEDITNLDAASRWLLSRLGR